MSNNNGNNSNNGNGWKVPPQLDQTELLEKTRTTLGGFPIKGTLFSTTANEVELAIEKTLNSLQVTQLDRVMVGIDTDRAGNVQGINCTAILIINDERPGNKNDDRVYIARNSYGPSNHNNGRRMITDFAPVARSGKGMFYKSAGFVNIFSSIAVKDENDNIIVKVVPSRNGKPSNAVTVDLDFFRVMSLVMEVTEDDPLDWSLISAEPIPGGDNYAILLSKFIQSSRRNRRKGVGGSNIDYGAIRRGLSSGNGGNNNRNRRFN